MNEIILQVCAEIGVTIIKGALSKDHVHMLVETAACLSQRLREQGQGAIIAQDPAGVRAHPQTLLGPTILGPGLLLDYR